MLYSWWNLSLGYIGLYLCWPKSTLEKYQGPTVIGISARWSGNVFPNIRNYLQQLQLLLLMIIEYDTGLRVRYYAYLTSCVGIWHFAYPTSYLTFCFLIWFCSYTYLMNWHHSLGCSLALYCTVSRCMWRSVHPSCSGKRCSPCRTRCLDCTPFPLAQMYLHVSVSKHIVL